ncbi:MAG: Asd/ArgC dimerization domain-containing protein [Acidimicrobiales bacterium]
MRMGVMGATGYAGGELLRLCASHPDLNVLVATGGSSAGKSIAQHIPSLAGAYPDLVVQPPSAILDGDLDVVFLCLPHGESQEFVPSLLERHVQVVDLGADYRLRDPDLYPTWYARPFIDANVIERDKLVVDALSGVSGAGRAMSERLQFSRLAANAEAYGLLSHRHTPEMEQEIGATVLFTPHLVPVARGMLVTAYARVSAALSSEDALAMLRESYALDPCVVVVDDPPTLKDPLGSNLCFVSARVDERTGWLVAMSSLDNLTKGAAGQAIQAWNVSSGRDETLGLPLAGVSP